MGADLIGFIFVGPENMRVSASKVNWNRIHKDFVRFLGDFGEDTPVYDLQTEGIKFLKTLVGEGSVKDLSKISVGTLKGKVLEVFKEFSDVWNGKKSIVRRWMFRPLRVAGSKKKLAVGVCAEMSWGDSPDDDMWELCEKIAFLDKVAAPVLGFENGSRSRRYTTLFFS